MTGRAGGWLERTLLWMNSIQVYILALVLGAIVVLTALSLSIMSYVTPEVGAPVSVYEMSRMVRGQPLAQDMSSIRSRTQVAEPRPSDDNAERLIAAALARRLGVSGGDVRVYLNDGDRARHDLIAREMALYGGEGAADPVVLGSFTIAVRTSPGQWRTITREARNPDTLWQHIGRNSVPIGLLVILPLSLWVSALLTRPIRAFAASAERLGAGIEESPVRVEGPTEIRMAARSLNEMQSRIARYIRERTSVVGAIAHDLRTPLSRLHFHLASAPEHVRKAAEEEIRQMEQLIGTTLDFVDNESRPRVMEPLDLGLLVEGLADDFADMGKDVAIADAQPVTIAGDVILLKRLFTNLIDNAVKYGGSARISVRREGPTAIVEVADNGPGMTDAQIARAFEPFFRGEPSRNPRTGGVGLGLSIVQSATEAHGGSVTLQQRAGGGLSARVALPLSD
ncbi:HAMP domain-containing sensor histidine kinase [Sphingomonas sp. LaA6.9]|uniref:sensor histidine kinase n=1 Tax=Sphingomonas sp. LaA6.9 TaxID=2919914 RepID=UPI001F4F9520|nr:ATP-binding protein [Sphingomonas sp. LaA6.9]MCJ8159083.1 ATP-binding protein [Sphingomonas sp. LaA6.9]